jgi:hypothetical protein
MQASSQQSSVFGRSSPSTFDIGPQLLCAQARFPRRSARSGGSTSSRDARSAAHHFSKFVEAILAIAFLIAIALRGENELAVIRQPVPLLGQESRLDVVRQTRRVQGVPAKYRLGSDLVHILTAGASGTGVAPLELAQRNPNPLGDVKHDVTLFRKSPLSRSLPSCSNRNVR